MKGEKNQVPIKISETYTEAGLKNKMRKKTTREKTVVYLKVRLTNDNPFFMFDST